MGAFGNLTYQLISDYISDTQNVAKANTPEKAKEVRQKNLQENLGKILPAIISGILNTAFNEVSGNNQKTQRNQR